MNATILSHELRCESGSPLERRRAIVALSLVAIGAMGAVTLFQTGLIKHLPEPELPLFDADKVDASDEAYEKLATPDAALGLVSYAVTLALAAAGGKSRAASRPWLPLAMAAKVGVDAMQAARLTVDQWVRHRAFCSYCLTAAAATFAMVPLVIPEARAAIGRFSKVSRAGNLGQLVRGGVLSGRSTSPTAGSEPARMRPTVRALLAALR